jgi:hypothetical protein
MEQYVVRSASVLIKQYGLTQVKSYLKLRDWKSSTECNISTNHTVILGTFVQCFTLHSLHI